MSSRRIAAGSEPTRPPADPLCRGCADARPSPRASVATPGHVRRSGPTREVWAVPEEPPQVHAETVAAWRSWLRTNHARSSGVNLVSWTTATGRPRITYDEAVTEALAYGWVDSKARTIDDERSMLWFCPRKPTSGWSRPNKRRVELLLAEGRMAPAGQAVIDLAKPMAGGSCSTRSRRSSSRTTWVPRVPRDPERPSTGRQSPGRPSAARWSGSCRPSGRRPAPGASSTPPTRQPAASAPDRSEARAPGRWPPAR